MNMYTEYVMSKFKDCSNVFPSFLNKKICIIIIILTYTIPLTDLQHHQKLNLILLNEILNPLI